MGLYLYDEDIRDSDTFRKFNHLAEEVDRMQPEDTLKLPGVLHLLCADHSVDSVLLAIGRMQDYTCLSEIQSDSDLGRYLVRRGMLKCPESLREYLNYSAIGWEFSASYGGTYTENGYVVPTKELPSALLPQQNDYAEVHLFVREWFRSLSDDDCSALLNSLPEDIPSLKTYAAVLYAEQPETLRHAEKLLRDLDGYQLIDESPYFYGIQRLKETLGLDEKAIDKLESYINFEQYGRDCMKNDGVQKTAFGSLRRCSQPVQKAEPLVGRVTYADGEVQGFTDAEAFLRCVREELPYRPTTGVRFEVLTDDPAVCKQVDDAIFDLYGEENPRQLEDYRQGMELGGFGRG